MYCNLFIFSLIFVLTKADYWSERHNFLQKERTKALGSKLILDHKEQNVNNILMYYKKQELQEGMKNSGKFLPAIHFFKAKKEIERSKVYSILKYMPKGAVLHTHDYSTVSADWVVKNVTYRDHLYACIQNGTWDMKFASPPPENGCWEAVSKLRNQSTSVDEFDNYLRTKFSLEVENPREVYEDANKVWTSFANVLISLRSVLSYRPVYEDFIYETHKNYYKDGVMYFEMSSSLLYIYELNGTLVEPKVVAGIINEVSKRFKDEYPNFFDMKIIYGANRQDSNETMKEKIELYKSLQELYPDLFAGFDIAAREDDGSPIVTFIPELLKHNITKFFFHAGETNWNGMFPDNDLIDAILMNTSRIGHGFAILKHPNVLEEVKQRDIAIEVNPISNQVLMFVEDLRNHPANFLIANGFPMVISSDNFGLWGASSLNHDFYVTFLGMTNAEDDLRVLKQLAINSIKYSALNNTAKNKLMDRWSEQWVKFINNNN